MSSVDHHLKTVSDGHAAASFKKKVLMFSALGVVVIGIIAAGVYFGVNRNKDTPALAQVEGRVSFVLESNLADFTAVQTDFIGELEFLTNKGEGTFSVEKSRKLSEFHSLIQVLIRAETQADVDALVSALNSAYASGRLSSYNVRSFYPDASVTENFVEIRRVAVVHLQQAPAVFDSTAFLIAIEPHTDTTLDVSYSIQKTTEGLYPDQTYVYVEMVGFTQDSINSFVNKLKGFVGQTVGVQPVVQVYPTVAELPDVSQRTPAPTTAAPTAAPTTSTPAPTMSQTAAPTLAAFLGVAYDTYINAGSAQPYTDVEGKTWNADSNFVGGKPSYAFKTGIALIDTQRYFGGLQYGEGYSFNVPNGVYEVGLFLSEVTFEAPGMRFFSVFVENQDIAGQIDIVSRATAPGLPVHIAFTTNVSDSMLDIKFNKLKQNPTVFGVAYKALDLPFGNVAAAPLPDTPEPFQIGVETAYKRYNMGYGAFTDNLGLAWESHTPINLLGVASGNVVSGNRLIDSEVFWKGKEIPNQGLNIRLPAGSYTFRFVFAELHFDFAKQRVFHMYVDGKHINGGKGIDILAKAGAKGKSVFIDYPVNVVADAGLDGITPDGSGNVVISVGWVTQNPKLNALAILGGPAAPLPTNTEVTPAPVESDPTEGILPEEEIIDETITEEEQVLPEEPVVSEEIVAP